MLTDPTLIFPDESCTQIYEATHGQQALYIKRKYARNVTPFNMLKVLTSSYVDLSLLQLAFKSLLERHDNLRSCFLPEQARAFVKIRPYDPALFAIRYQDLRELNEDQATTCMRACSDKLFDLHNDALIQLTVLHKEESLYLIAIVIDHILSDAWSMEILEEELTGFYYDLTVGKTSEITPMSMQFADYACWQKTRLQGISGESLLRFWKDIFAVPVPILPLGIPTDIDTGSSLPGYRDVLKAEILKHFVPVTEMELQGMYGYLFSAQPPSGGAYRTVVDKPVLDELQAIAGRLGVSLFTILLTALYLLLHRRTGQHDIVIGTPVSLREQDDTGGLIGWFLDTLLFRIVSPADSNFMQLVHQVAALVGNALDHRSYPMELIMDKLNLSALQVGRVFIHLLNFDTTDTPLTDFTKQHLRKGTPTFDINFTFSQYNNGIEIVCDYRDALFAPAYITAITEELASMLTSLHHR